MPEAEGKGPNAAPDGLLPPEGAASTLGRPGGGGGPHAAPEETLLAFDFGEKKIGVAIGNTLTRQARPLEIIFGEERATRFGRIAALLAEWQPQRLVVGLALDADGGEQPATARCRRFANQLHGRYALPVALVDERGSSMEAQALLGSNAADDAMAAMVILQRYLDALP